MSLTKENLFRVHFLTTADDEEDNIYLMWTARDERVPGGVAWGEIIIKDDKDGKVTIDTERMGKKFALEAFAKLLKQAEYAEGDKDLAEEEL